MQSNRRSFLQYATLCAVGLSGVAGTGRATDAEDREIGSVEGRVTHFGQPIADAVVEIAETTATTDDDGEFELNVESGARTASVSADGYASETQDIDVSLGETTTVDIELDEEWGPRQGALDVIVSEPGGGPGIPCDITLFGSETETLDVPLGAIPDDVFWPDELIIPEGWWELRVSNADGYSDGYKRVYIEAGETEFAWIRLGDDEDATIPELGTVEGRVVDQRARSVPDATVTIGDERVVTDADGRFELELEHGSYDLTATAAGYRDSQGEALVKFGRTTNLTVGIIEE